MINSPALLTALAPPSPSPPPGGAWPRLPRRDLKRPRGLWKARRRLDSALNTQSQQLLQTPSTSRTKTTPRRRAASSSGRASDTDREEEESGGEYWREEGLDEDEGEDDGEDDVSQKSGSSKRPRRDSRSGSCGSAEVLWAAVYVDPAAKLGLGLGLGTGLVSTAPPSADAGVPAPQDTLGMAMAMARPALCRGAGAGDDPPPAINDDDGRAAPALIPNMIMTSIAESASSTSGVAAVGVCAKETFEYGDWEAIKETLARASELCDRDDLAAAIPLLRAVIHECHRFLVRFPDPSLFFASSRPVGQRWRAGSDSPDSVIVMQEERPWHDHEPTWSTRQHRSRMSTSPSPSPCSSLDSDDGQSEHRSHPRHHRGGEPHNALHAAFGVALFLFGTIIARDSSLALAPREPTSPSPYWLAALDVFNAGDNLPCQTSGKDVDAPASTDEWRVAIAWGRTLVALANEATKQQRQQQQRRQSEPSSSQSSPPPSPTARLSPSTPRPRPIVLPARYHPRSPLAAIAALRAAAGGSGCCGLPPSELLTLAADQFARGIFHMPHHATTRPHVLFVLAEEVLCVAERLEDAAARVRWGAWAESMFLQMQTQQTRASVNANVNANASANWEATTDADIDPRVGVAWGRCWVVVGCARAEGMEDALERGEAGMLASKEAEDARVGLNTAISLFDRAKRSTSAASLSPSDKSPVNVQPWLTEALVALANLTADKGAREALYVRARAEGGTSVAPRDSDLELGPRLARSRTITAADVRMDES